jgi:hypothetical protein
VDNGVRNNRKLDRALRNSVDNFVHSASVSDNSNKTPEEIEAEEEARRNGENVGAMAAAGVMVYDYLTSQSEPQDTAEDEDVGFTQSM